jgi:hypothetical protein
VFSLSRALTCFFSLLPCAQGRGSGAAVVNLPVVAAGGAAQVRTLALVCVRAGADLVVLVFAHADPRVFNTFH